MARSSSFLISLALYLLMTLRVFAAEEHNTATASADATEVFDPVTLTPSIIYQSNIAGQIQATVTEGTLVEQPSTTRAVYTATSTIDAWAASKVETNQIGYTIPLMGMYDPFDPDLDDVSVVYAVCWYPISGYYGRLARLLYYGSMFFAVLAHRFEWLIMGALATGITYSSVAALQAMIMVWSNQGIGNPDGIIILGLLAFSLAMLVPLLNWSSTINKLGAEREEDSVGRSIIIVWGLVLTLAFLSLFAGVWAPVEASTPEDAKKIVQTPLMYSWYASAENITCSPASGVLDMAAGQDSHWEPMYASKEFVEYNNCESPCKDGVNWPIKSWKTILRNPDGLIPLDMHQINTFVGSGTEDENLLSRQQTANIEIANSFLMFGTLFMILLIVQGIWAVFLGRRSPKQVRNWVYWVFTKFLPRKPDSREPRPWVHKLAKTLAILTYVWTLFTSFCAAILIVAAIFTTEWFANEIPNSDHSYQVDQWAGMVATGFVLVAAVVFQFQGILQDVFFRGVNKLVLLIHNTVHHKKKNFCSEGAKANVEARTKSSTSRVSNKSLLADSIKALLPWHHEPGDPDAPKPKTWRQDWHDFWNNPRKVIKVYGSTGGTHVRARRVAGEEHAQLIEMWNKGAGDEWLDISSFIAELQKFDERSRSSGKHYKFKPRIIEETEVEERTRFNWKLVADTFRKHNARYKWSTSVAGSAAPSVYEGLSRHATDTSMSYASDATFVGQRSRANTKEGIDDDDEEAIQLHAMAAPEQTSNPFGVRQYTPLS